MVEGSLRQQQDELRARLRDALVARFPDDVTAALAGEMVWRMVRESGLLSASRLGNGEDRWPLVEAMHAVCPRTAWSYRECGACASRVNAIWPFVAAARQETAQRCAEAIENLTVRHHDKTQEPFLVAVRDRCAALARETTTKGSEDG